MTMDTTAVLSDHNVLQRGERWSDAFNKGVSGL